MISDKLVEHVARGMAVRANTNGFTKAEKAVWVNIFWWDYRKQARAVLRDIEKFNEGAPVTTPPKDN